MKTPLYTGKGCQCLADQIHRHVQFNADELKRSMRKMMEQALRDNKLSVDEARVLLKFYENGLEGYTYLE
jgi:arginine decarboxylase